MDEEEFLSQVLGAIAEAETIAIFFPILRRALVVDIRHDESTSPLVKVMPQVQSMEERIKAVERLRPELGKVRSILGVPWMKSVRRLREHGVTDRLIERLVEVGMPPSTATATVHESIEQLWRLECMAFARMIRGEGYKTIWAAKR